MSSRWDRGGVTSFLASVTLSKQIKKWEAMGLLVVVDPLASKARRSYVKPGSDGIQMSFVLLGREVLRIR